MNPPDRIRRHLADAQLEQLKAFFTALGLA
jgi:hypothetical protein